jgi:hypothetical protein
MVFYNSRCLNVLAAVFVVMPHNCCSCCCYNCTPSASCILRASLPITNSAVPALLLSAAQAGADGFDSRVYLANRLENKTNMSESKTRNYAGGHIA